MVDKKASVKSRKRQPAKVPLSRVKKSSVAPRSTKKATSSGKKRPLVNKKKVFSLWFGPKYRLQIKKVNAPKKKKRASKKPSKKTVSIKSKKQNLAIAAMGIVAALYFSSTLFVSQTPPIVYSAPAPAQVVSTPKEDAVDSVLEPSVPVSLRIDSVGINTQLSTVGRNVDGTLTVPSSYDIAGWYKYSPTPGELGPAIITGHVDSYKGPAVFWRLGQVALGDTISITREDGSVVSYSVTAVKQFDQANFPTEEVYGDIDHVGLRLITCGGIYNRTTQRYSDNTVVYARLAE